MKTERMTIDDVKELEQKHMFGYFAEALAFVLVYLLSLFLVKPSQGVGAFVRAIPVVLLLVIDLLISYRKNRKESAKLFKKVVVDSVASDMFQDYEFFEDVGFTEEAVASANLIDGKLTKFKSEDLIRGDCKGISFTRSEVHAGDFQGIWIVYKNVSDMFPEGLRVLTRDYMLSVDAENLFRKDGVQYVASGDPDFDRVFYCFGDDESAVRATMNETAREHLQKIRSEIKWPFALAMNGNDMVVAVRTDMNQIEMPEHVGEDNYWKETAAAQAACRPVVSFAEFLLRDLVIMEDTKPLQQELY